MIDAPGSQKGLRTAVFSGLESIPLSRLPETVIGRNAGSNRIHGLAGDT
jgi:hypothetical protein